MSFPERLLRTSAGPCWVVLRPVQTGLVGYTPFFQFHTVPLLQTECQQALTWLSFRYSPFVSRVKAGAVIPWQRRLHAAESCSLFSAPGTRPSELIENPHSSSLDSHNIPMFLRRCVDSSVLSSSLWRRKSYPGAFSRGRTQIQCSSLCNGWCGMSCFASSFREVDHWHPLVQTPAVLAETIQLGEGWVFACRWLWFLQHQKHTKHKLIYYK